MESKSIRKIALWLLDRIEAGQYEENGSSDSTYFGAMRVTITKAEEEYLVYMSECIIPDFTLTEQMTLAEVEQEIKNWLMD